MITAKITAVEGSIMKAAVWQLGIAGDVMHSIVVVASMRKDEGSEDGQD